VKRIDDANVWRVYAITLILGVAYGLAIAVLALWLDAHRFHETDIGSLAAFFAAGIVIGSIPAGWIVRKVGGKRVLVACLSVFAVVVGLYSVVTSYEGIAALRVVDGAVSVGIWVSCETILLARAKKEHKAFVMSLYAIAIGIGYVVGPLVARGIVAFFPMASAFVTSCVLAAGAALLAIVTLEDLPLGAAEDHAKGSGAPALAILWKIKTSCFATFAYGYFQASVVLFMPLFLRDVKHIDEGSTVMIPAFFAAGLLAFSNVAGRLGDRQGHLMVMRVLATIGGAMVLAFVAIDRFWIMGAAVFVAGATLASISPVSLGLQGNIVAPEDYGRANGMYNAFYAAGMLLGPPISSQIFHAKGGEWMLVHLAALWAAFVIFAWAYRKDDPRHVTPKREMGYILDGPRRTR
jgi:MFS family permease